MSYAKESTKAVSLQVTEGLSVTVIPNPSHEFLMTTKEVASGYGTSKYAIQKAYLRNSSELYEGKHFETARTICPHDPKIPHNSVLWTKRGIVRLGFFIKSERAKLFRDWAEELIIKVEEQRDLFGASLKFAPKQLTTRNHNRLTQERMISILADVCRIDDRELRLSITNKLMKGGQA